VPRATEYYKEYFIFLKQNTAKKNWSHHREYFIFLEQNTAKKNWSLLQSRERT